MTDLQRKTAILNAGKAKHETVINDYRKEIDDLRANEMVAGGQRDAQELSYTSEIKEQIGHLADQLDFAIAELHILNQIQIEEPLHDMVKLGSVVVTDKRSFFVSVSIEDFEAEGKKYFGLSTKTPIYQIMRGKKKGDRFAYNETEYVIKDLF